MNQKSIENPVKKDPPEYPWTGMPLCEHKIQFDCQQCKLIPTISQIVITSAHNVFDELGTGHSEAVYESAMIVELGLQGLSLISRQVACPITYKGFTVGVGFIDIVISNNFAVELKAVAKLSNRDELQVRKYLLGSGIDHGLLINFTQPTSGTTWEGVDAVEISLESKEPVHDETISEKD